MIQSQTQDEMARKSLDFSELDRIMTKYTSELPNALRSVTFSVIDNQGNTLYSRAAGTQKVDQQSAPLTTDTPLWTASLTKLVTTVACMIAVDQGLIGLDDNVRDIVPELKDVEILVGFEDSDSKEGPRKPILKKVDKPITMRQLLSHTSGFTYDVFDAGLMEWSRGIGRKAHSHCGSYEGYMHPLIHEPGCGWAYGPGMDWAGRTVEILSGQTLEEYMQEHIFSKLNMTQTTFHPELREDNYLDRRVEHAIRDPATGVIAAGGQHHLLAMPAKDCIGGMGIYSTPSDLVKILKEVLCGGGSILTQKSVDEMLKSQLDDITNAAFMEVIDGRAKYHLRQTWPEGYKGDFGLSASINVDDFPGRRLKNSVNWAGSAGLHAWLDPTSGVGGLLTTQLSPPGDKMFTECLLDLETALYTELRRNRTE